MDQLTFLGTGTSTGVPMIGCSCSVCRSPNAKDKRMRSSVWIQAGGMSVVIDTSTDFRTQALAVGMTALDAVFFTHYHADHIHGIDDLRSFNFIHNRAIECYGGADALERIRGMFGYIFDGRPDTGGGKPRLELNAITAPVTVGGLTVEPIPVMHGELEVYGYRVNKTAYVTDCSRIPEPSLRRLEGLDCLILGALGIKSHPTHFTLEQALAAISTLAPKRAYLTHLNHNIGHDEVSANLPPNVFLAYDGLAIGI
ncbi:MAG: MBL fold metallo-hydrolase [Nitrospinae bacterium]|nr:MBL fold metallo-hydrolase [Nitrospinota bacterium]